MLALPVLWAGDSFSSDAMEPGSCHSMSQQGNRSNFLKYGAALKMNT